MVPSGLGVTLVTDTPAPETVKLAGGTAPRLAAVTLTSRGMPRRPARARRPRGRGRRAMRRRAPRRGTRAGSRDERSREHVDGLLRVARVRGHRDAIEAQVAHVAAERDAARGAQLRVRVEVGQEDLDARVG